MKIWARKLLAKSPIVFTLVAITVTVAAKAHKHGHGTDIFHLSIRKNMSIGAHAVCNDSTQAVLTADLTAPDKLQYLINRDLGTGPFFGG